MPFGKKKVTIAATAAFIPFDDMVGTLFKAGKALGNEYGGAMHAAIGIAGEVVELRNASTRENIIEECGDLEFYMTALKLEIPAFEAMALQLGKIEFPFILSQTEGLLHDASGTLIDVVKKGWVYNKKIDTETAFKCWVDMRAALNQYYNLTGLTRDQIIEANQNKLIGPNGRYPNGKYSDAAAQARADKA
jgi:hypothetical protein